jgi:hypothetical protein
MEFGQLPVRAAVLFTSATFPAVAAIATKPIASGAGMFAPLLPPDACWIK